MQAGHREVERIFYPVITSHIKDGDTLLNLGSGTQFYFERELSKLRKIELYSSDILLPLETIPLYVKHFFHADLETQVNFGKQFDVVTFFEVLEHIDKTDMLIRNAIKHLKDDGLLIFSCPNLSSLWGRIELLMGFQPHILEVSNEFDNLGTGLFGTKFNNPGKHVVHHIRGFTTRALIEFVNKHSLEIIKLYGTTEVNGFKTLFKIFPLLASQNIFVCKKK